MQILHCTVGRWRAEAEIEEVENGSKLMAVVLVTDEYGNAVGESTHTMVFDHVDGASTIDETRTMVRQLIASRYEA